VTAPFSVRVYYDETVISMVLTGEIDLAARDAVGAALADGLAERPTIRRLVVDLSGVSFIDSSGLSAAIVVPARTAEELGITFEVVTGEGVLRALELSGLDRFVRRGEDG
jgi:anti-sigma B factor antagonist